MVSHISNFEVGDGKIISNYTQSDAPPQITHMAVRNVLREKNGIMWEKFPNWGGGYDPNPLLDVYIPSYFWHAKMILRC